jgi:hypothetical protein
MDWQKKKLEIIANMNFLQGQLHLCEEAIKDQQTCELNSDMVPPQLERVQTTHLTESQENHGSNVTSARSASQDRKVSSTTGSGS